MASVRTPGAPVASGQGAGAGQVGPGRVLSRAGPGPELESSTQGAAHSPGCTHTREPPCLLVRAQCAPHLRYTITCLYPLYPECHQPPASGLSDHQ